MKVQIILAFQQQYSTVRHYMVQYSIVLYCIVLYRALYCKVWDCIKVNKIWLVLFTHDTQKSRDIMNFYNEPTGEDNSDGDTMPSYSWEQHSEDEDN